MSVPGQEEQRDPLIDAPSVRMMCLLPQLLLELAFFKESLEAFLQPPVTGMFATAEDVLAAKFQVPPQLHLHACLYFCVLSGLMSHVACRMPPPPGSRPPASSACSGMT